MSVATLACTVSGGYKGVATVLAETFSDNRSHARNQFMEWVQEGEIT